MKKETVPETKDQICTDTKQLLICNFYSWRGSETRPLLEVISRNELSNSRKVLKRSVRKRKSDKYTKRGLRGHVHQRKFTVKKFLRWGTNKSPDIYKTTGTRILENGGLCISWHQRDVKSIRRHGWGRKS